MSSTLSGHFFAESTLVRTPTSGDILIPPFFVQIHGTPHPRAAWVGVAVSGRAVYPGTGKTPGQLSRRKDCAGRLWSCYCG